MGSHKISFLNCPKLTDENFSKYKILADNGSTQAQYEVAKYYQNHKNIDRACELAIHYYKLVLVANQGYFFAHFALAKLFLDNKIQESEAVAHLKLAIKNKDCPRDFLSSCEYHLGKCFEKGTGVKKSSQDALKYYKSSAEHGNGLAQERIGDAYLNGELGLHKNSEKGVEYYQVAANNNEWLSPFPLESLGRCYEEGNGVKQSKEQAFHYYSLAAEIGMKEGYSLPIASLARCYELGIGTEQSLEKAIHYYKFAAENNDSSLYVNVGDCYKAMGGNENTQRAIKYFEMAAEVNDPAACSRLIEIYELGIEVEKSEEMVDMYKRKKFSFFKERYADKGNSFFQAVIGEYFQKGYGVQQSIAHAIHYYQLSAQQNDPDGLHQLARCFRDGIGVEQSTEKAMQYYKLAADQGHYRSQQFLAAYLLEKNIEVEQAVYYLKLAIQNEDEDRDFYTLSWCEYYLGGCYFNGFGVEKSIHNAFLHYEKSADLGLSLAQEKIGDAYLNGELGLEKNIAKAIECYQLAADQGSSYAIEQLGHCHKIVAEKDDPVLCVKIGKYYLALGGSENDQKAIEYFKMGAALDNIAACHRLVDAYEQGIGVEKSEELANKYKQKLFSIYKKLADKGNPSFQVKLGNCFKIGYGTEKSMEFAVHYYQLAVEQNDPDGLYFFARCLENGCGVPKSLDKAIHYYRIAAELGDSASRCTLAYWLLENRIQEEEAFRYLNLVLQDENCRPSILAISKYLLGFCFAHGAGVEQSNQKALHYYNNAINEHRSDVAQERMGDAFLKGELGLEEDIRKAIEYYRLAANQGRLSSKKKLHAALNRVYKRINFFYFRKMAEYGRKPALEKLGDAYLHSELGFKKNPEKAFEYYQLAAEQNYSSALVKLGYCYEEGIGVRQSQEEAFHCYLLAAELDMKEGNSHSISTLARCYELGIGTEQSFEKAINFYKIAAADNPSLYVKVGECYKTLGGTENEQKAIQYFELAAGADDLTTYIELIKAYEAKDYAEKIEKIAMYKEKIFLYSKRQADDGNSYFQAIVGNYFEIGYGHEKSIELAIQYYQLSANQNNLLGLFRLAQCYENGIFVQPSAEKAIHYYKLAADLGHSLSQWVIANYFLETNLNLLQALHYFKLSMQNGRCSPDMVAFFAYKIANYLENKKESGDYIEKVFLCYLISAEYGYPLAQERLGNAYLNGDLGLEKNREIAIEYHQLVADWGMVNSTDNSSSHLDIKRFNKKRFLDILEQANNTLFQTITVDCNDPQEYGLQGNHNFRYISRGMLKDHKESINSQEEEIEQSFPDSQAKAETRLQIKENEKQTRKISFVYKLKSTLFDDINREDEKAKSFYKELEIIISSLENIINNTESSSTKLLSQKSNVRKNDPEKIKTKRERMNHRIDFCMDQIEISEKDSAMKQKHINNAIKAKNIISRVENVETIMAVVTQFFTDCFIDFPELHPVMDKVFMKKIKSPEDFDIPKAKEYGKIKAPHLDRTNSQNLAYDFLQILRPPP